MFINHALKVAAGVLCVFLVGCSSILPTAQSPADHEAAVENTAEKGGAAEPALMPEELRPVNPYLKNRKPVPAGAQELFASALAAMEEQQWQKAEGYLLSLTSEYPTLSGAYLNLGICYRQLSKNDVAEDYFKQCIKVNANNLDAYNWLALIKRERGDFKAAEQLYQQALDIWPDHAASHYNLGILCELYMGNLERARQHYLAYQNLQSEPNRRVAGWLKDIQRRIQALAENEVTK